MNTETDETKDRLCAICGDPVARDDGAIRFRVEGHPKQRRFYHGMCFEEMEEAYAEKESERVNRREFIRAYLQTEPVSSFEELQDYFNKRSNPNIDNKDLREEYGNADAIESAYYVWNCAIRFASDTEPEY